MTSQADGEHRYQSLKKIESEKNEYARVYTQFQSWDTGHRVKLCLDCASKHRAVILPWGRGYSSIGGLPPIKLGSQDPRDRGWVLFRLGRQSCLLCCRPTISFGFWMPVHYSYFILGAESV